MTLPPAKFFQIESSSLLSALRFAGLCEALKNKETDFNLMAIENSIAGSILPNYLLLEQFRAPIVGELYLRIEMNLMALKGQKISDLESVQSHPMALFQCEEFLFQHPHLKVIESADTAESARDISARGLKRQGAIASRLAAETYDLEILAGGIETNKQNYTRFLVVSRGERVSNSVADKASMRFEVAHRPGSLVSILSSFTAHGVNMTMLQSVPILGRPYEYSFHVDLEWQDEKEYRQALREIEMKAVNFVLLGEYKKDERPGL